MVERVYLAVAVDGEASTMTLDRFLEENEGAPSWCEAVRALGPGEQLERGGFTVRRVQKPQRPRVVRLSVPWNFDGSKAATVAINRDTGIVTFRGRGRRKLHHLELGRVLEVAASREAQAAALERRKARRSRR